MARPYLLNPSEPHPVRAYRGNSGSSPFLLIGDHAGLHFPEALGDLGVGPADRARHIACDIGVERLGRAIAERLDAVFLSQAYSRLVVDCNRHPGDRDWIPVISDGTPIPGNAGLTHADRAARQAEIFEPYHAAIARELDQRAARGDETVLVSLHSFTPEMAGLARPWDIGILHDGRQDRFARAVLANLERTGLTIGDNEPYRMDATDYTVPRHAYPRELSYVEVEVRQDWLGKRPEEAAEILCEALEAAALDG